MGGKVVANPNDSAGVEGVEIVEAETSVQDVGDLRLADLPSERREVAELIGEGPKRDEDQTGGLRVWLEEAASSIDAAIEEGVGVESKKAVRGAGSS